MTDSVAARERPILFSGAMVRAILDGRKSQTRRVVKAAHLRTLATGATRARKEWGDAQFVEIAMRDARDVVRAHCPYGQPGDRLWARETWAPVSPDENYRPIEECRIEYRADTPNATRAGSWDEAPDDPDAIRWRPSIHMPRWASRITLEITDVHVERVQDISDDEAWAEGVSGAARPGFEHLNGLPRASVAFRDLWDSINATRGFGWDMNPWVWVVAFRKVAA